MGKDAVAVGDVEQASGRFSNGNGRTWGEPVDLFGFPLGLGEHLDGMAPVTRNGALHL